MAKLSNSSARPGKATKKDGNRLMFVTSDGEIIKQFRKAWESNEEGCLDKVMADFANQKETVSTEETATEE